jgi:Lar family restriction alleviation protein
MSKIKPCPFCGGKITGYDSDFEAVFCSQCEAHIHCDDKALGIEVWNARVSDGHTGIARIIESDTGLNAPPFAPCPFCGSAAVVKDEDGEYPYVECVGCGAIGPGKSKDDACSAWNRRAEE